MSEWMTGLPPELAANPDVSKHPDLAALVKSYVNGQAVIAARPQSMADMDAPTDAALLAAVQAKLGRPETAAGYENIGNDDAFRNAAHKHGLTKAQATALFSELTTANTAARETAEAKYAEQVETRKTESEATYRGKWGDKYDPNMALVKQALEHYFPEAARQEFETLGLVHEPYMIEHLQKLGGFMGEDSLLGHGGTGSPARDLKTVEAELVALRTSKEYQDVINNPISPQYKDMVAKNEGLLTEAAKIATNNGAVAHNEKGSE